MFFKLSARRWFALLTFVSVALLPLVSLAATSYNIDVNADRRGAVYKVGEKVDFRVTALADGKPITEGDLFYVLSTDGHKALEQGTVEFGEKPLVISGQMDTPGFLRCLISYQPKAEDGGKAPPRINMMAAAAISPEEIGMSLPVPDDFDEFWDAQKKKLDEMPMKPVLTPVESGSEKMECFDVKVNCPGGAPVSGYFGRPKDAKPKSLPAILWVHGAGVYSARLAEAQKAESLNMLSMDLNAHGVPNGLPQEQYDKMFANELHKYFYQNCDDREAYYFNGMFLRLKRALDFLTAQPEWDGKTLIVVGHSQGGAQALVAGGLDPRVSFVGAGVPAMCDHSGIAIDRIPGWPQLLQNGLNGKPKDKVMEVARYYDAVNFATRIKGEAIMSVGFIDGVCPATTGYAAYNQIRGKKRMINEPKMQHAAPPHIHAAFDRAIAEHVKQRQGKSSDNE